jgi:hypothetical protein
VPVDYLDGPSNPGGPGTLGSFFEIDGNLTDDNEGPVVDWGSPELNVLNVLDPPIVDLSPDIFVDDSFTDGSKEDDTNPTIEDTSVPPNKSDLTNFLIAQDEVDGNGFLALGWIRTDSLGTSNFDFELNQSTVVTANGVTPERTDGDALISFDFESSGNVVLLTLREWDGPAQEWGAPRSLNIEGTGFAAVNDPELFGTIPEGEPNPFGTELLPDQSFGEALINLTQAFDSGCRTFVSAYVKGRSSTPFTAALKDFIAPVEAEISTCRTIDMLNEASSDASNPGQDPVSDTAIVTLSNDPRLYGDPDGDGIRNYIDPDDDGDGFNDNVDAFPYDPSEWADTDGDGVGDNADAFPDDPTETRDTDGDGVGDNGDAFPNDPAETVDTDGDGVGDNGDAFPNDPSDTADTDGDGVGDNADAFPTDSTETTDTDGEGVGDNSDVFPTDPNESADTDGDGVGDNADAFPNDPTETVDTDGDGVGDNSDEYPLLRFHDVPTTYWAYRQIEALAAQGIVWGCGNNNYCPLESIEKQQMAIILLKAKYGADYIPPQGTGLVFDDVPANHWLVSWIEKARADNILTGCGDGNFCPNAKVTRGSMTKSLLIAKHGPTYIPPAPTGIFTDVPFGTWYEKWAAAYIEASYAQGISLVCWGDRTFCPDTDLTRAEMAVWVTRAFDNF